MKQAPCIECGSKEFRDERDPARCAINRFCNKCYRHAVTFSYQDVEEGKFVVENLK